MPFGDIKNLVIRAVSINALVVDVNNPPLGISNPPPNPGATFTPHL